MARHSKGILGDFYGKVGTVIGGNWKGVPYMRSLPRRVKNRKVSDAQIEQQARFGMGIRFIRGLSAFLKLSFVESGQKTNKNIALSQLLAQSVGGVYPNLVINYSTVQVAKGSLKKADNPAVAANVAGTLDFSWTDTSGLGNGVSSDVAMLVAYCPEIEEFMYSTNAGTRDQGNATLDVRFFSGKEVHAWIAFRSAEGKQASDSSYLGTVTVL